jgi:hypothetical protein
MKKKWKLSPEALRLRRVAFYNGVPRDTLRKAARRAKEPRRRRTLETTASVP